MDFPYGKGQKIEQNSSYRERDPRAEGEAAHQVRDQRKPIFSSTPNSDTHKTEVGNTRLSWFWNSLNHLCLLAQNSILCFKKQEKIKRKNMSRTVRGDGKIWICSRKIKQLHFIPMIVC